MCKVINQKGIMRFHQGIRKDRKDAVYVRYLLNGMKIGIAHAITINWEQGHFVVGKWGKRTEKKL